MGIVIRTILTGGRNTPGANGIVADRRSKLPRRFSPSKTMRNPTMTILTTADADDATSNMRIPGGS